METLTIKDWRQKRPITVRSYTRGRGGVGAATRTNWKALLRQSVITGLSATIVISSYVVAFEAGKVSMFTSADWDNITHLTLVEVSKAIPIPGVQASEMKMADPVVVKDGKTQTLRSFCKQAIKDHRAANLPIAGDLADNCL